MIEKGSTKVSAVNSLFKLKGVSVTVIDVGKLLILQVKCFIFSFF